MLAALALFGPHATLAQIPLADLEPMFARLRQAGWNVDRPLLWSYFFIGKDAAALDNVRGKLASQGYRHADTSTHRGGVLLLQMDRVETHSVASLHRRNEELFSLAASLGNIEYEGVEAGRTLR
jgi:hypothetical protein